MIPQIESKFCQIIANKSIQFWQLKNSQSCIQSLDAAVCLSRRGGHDKELGGTWAFDQRAIQKTEEKQDNNPELSQIGWVPQYRGDPISSMN